MTVLFVHILVLIFFFCNSDVQGNSLNKLIVKDSQANATVM